MQFLFIITLLLGLTFARPKLPRVALAQFHLEPFNLTGMGVECTKKNTNSSLFGCSIQFKWEDPNANKSCTCKEDWQWNGVPQSQGPMNNYSTEYIVCKNDRTELFQFKFMDMFDLSNFSLSLTHENFPAPTMANMFSQPNITLKLIEKSNTTMVYSSACDCPIKANITGITI
ncbi:hypothetical protein F4805DRAFT_471125 [Annulohypoxylon moriforme]|nr:hypothetical protein F4805DRAFT_471125 [Annulohypoxylon moriforme]